MMKRKTKKCHKCGREISLSNFQKHIESCNGQKNDNKILNEKWKIDENLYRCPICKKEFTKSGIVSHYIYAHTEKKMPKGKNHPKYGKSGENSWSIAKKNGVEHIMSKNQKEYLSSEKCHNHLRNVGNNWWKDPKSLEKFKKSIRLAIERNPEAYSANNVCGRTKIIEYRGFKLNGSWEFEVAKWLDDNNIEWTNKIKKGFEYFWDGGFHLYFPDFYLPEYNMFIEVKGYERERDRCKWSVVDNLIILKKNEINKIRNKTYIAQW